MTQQTFNSNPSFSNSSLALARYRETVALLQKRVSEGPSLNKEALLIVEAERKIAKDIEEVFSYITDDFVDVDALKTLEWCLLEHANLCAVWLDAFQKKKFRKLSGSKVWVPVILNVYSRLNRLTFLSRVLRNQQSSEAIFVNLIRAVNFALMYKNIATIVDPPYGDGRETVVGALITCSLLQHSLNPKLTPSALKELEVWFRENASLVKVSRNPPEKLSATLVVQFDRMSIPQWVPYNGVQDAPNRMFLNVVGLKSEIDGLSLNEKFSFLGDQLFRRDSSFLKVVPIELTPFDFTNNYTWLVEPHKPFIQPDFVIYQTEKSNDSEVVVRFPKNQMPKINQLWLARLQDPPMLHIGFVKRVDLSDFHSLALIEWLGRRPFPIEVRSEWADIADSLRSTDWLNGIIVESIEQKSVLKMFIPHTSLASGEIMSCRLPSNHKDWGDLFFSRLLEIYTNFQLVEVRRN